MTGMHDFLSEEWIAAARELRQRYADDVPDLPVAVRINQTVTDVPFQDDELHAYVDTSSGTLEVELGQLDDADVTISTDYELARMMVVGGDPQIFMQAFLEGRVRVQGDFAQLIALQAAVAQQADHEAAAQLGADLQAITN